MNHLALISILLISSTACTVQAQRQIKEVQSSAADSSALEGVTMKNGQSTMLIVSNAKIQRATTTLGNSVQANNVIAPTFLQRVGPYEIHRTVPSSVASASASKAQSNLTVNGQSVPAFAELGTGQDFLGTAYLQDTKQMGLISKEISVKFKTGSVPAQYAGMGAKELVPRSGLYIFTATDIYAWVKLVSRLQADSQVSLVEPNIVTEFAQAQ
jgi:hypothetical protein